MVTIRSRGEHAQPSEAIQLTAKFYDFSGNLTDLDSFPTVSIIQPSGNVAITTTSAGVYRLAVGTYAFLYQIPYTSDYGVFTDRWQGTFDGYVLKFEYNFVVELSQQPSLNTDGYAALGDFVPFNYSQTAINNINQLLKGLKARLNSSGKSKRIDQFGNVVYEDCDIYTIDQLVVFLATALSAFNEIPTFTEFTFEDSEIMRIYYDVIMQYALILALSSKALLERGREFTITDNGVSFNPPGVSEVLMTQYSAEMGNWNEKVKLIKANMKPSPLGLSNYATLTSPRIRILRNLRQRVLL